MANLDTAAKRRSAMHVGPPFLPMFPVADNTIDQGDRQQATWQYRGILASEPEDVVVGNQRYIGGGGWNGGMFDHVRVSFEQLVWRGVGSRVWATRSSLCAWRAL